MLPAGPAGHQLAEDLSARGGEIFGFSAIAAGHQALGECVLCHLFLNRKPGGMRGKNLFAGAACGAAQQCRAAVNVF